MSEPIERLRSSSGIGLRRRGDPPLDLRAVGVGDAAGLADLLTRIDTTFFRPHPMTAAEAHRIAALQGCDVYLIGRLDGLAVSYGMLRGWDDGFDIPSLGVAVRNDILRRGFGRATMLRLHEIARERGSARVRLRVHPDNLPAAAMYRALGYTDVGVERGERLMMLSL
jgi:ribosomal-protein-alanine N-acetyltransferase